MHVHLLNSVSSNFQLLQIEEEEEEADAAATV